MTSKTRSRHRMRCSSCGTRFALKRHPDLYVRIVKCPDCKSMNVYSAEASRRREVENQNTCCCNAYPFPHRAGSLRMCHEHHLGLLGVDPTDEEIRNYQACLATPRSGAT